ncbi:MAG: transcriptional regulator [Flavipsychrobacter sp.]|jgi:CheY-like chemotaxis protein|nr:transcriptional regulator [Flavipsychrobacter sp.]
MNPVKTIYIIDDDKLFVFLTRKSIEETNLVADIKEFGDGQVAIENLKKIAGDTEQLPDIIFLDLSMPVMDGWEFLKEYITLEPKIDKKIKLYIFSSSISPHDIERANSIGVVTDFIIKPLSKEKFIEVINS